MTSHIVHVSLVQWPDKSEAGLSQMAICLTSHLGFSEIQAELTNLPILPNLPNFFA